MFDVVSGDTSTLEDFDFEAPTNGDSTLGHKHGPRPPKLDFGETIQQQQQQQKHRGLNQNFHKTI